VKLLAYPLAVLENHHNLTQVVVQEVSMLHLAMPVFVVCAMGIALFLE